LARTDPDRAAGHTLVWVQGLRAAAALSVAFVHFTNDAVSFGADPSGALHAIARFMPWDAGVDIFFVISGFIIVHASAPLFGAPGASWRFLRRRLTRIVPLYWLTTALFLLILWRDGGAIHGDIGGGAFIAASFLFIPWPRPDGIMQPAFGLGWTLNYEMFFYLVLACCLSLPRKAAVAAAAGVLCALILLDQLGHFPNPQFGFWSSPLTLEFCAGMAIAQARAAGFRLNVAPRLLLPLAALVILHLTVQSAPQFRPFAFGIPALMLVAAAALGRPAAALSRRHLWMVRLGDASYALYLVHPFVMRAMSIPWHRFHAQTAWAGTMYILIGLLVAQLCALLIHVLFERKLTGWLRGRRGSLVNEAV